MLYDCHMHSRFSFDSEMNELEACKTAKKIGLKGITFTEHLDYDFPEESYTHPDLNDYIVSISRAKRSFPDLEIYHGVEVGYQSHVMSEVNDVLQKYPFDYVINSVHVLDKQDLYETYYSDKTKHEVYVRYLQEIEHSVKAANYDVIGHIGYLCRYSPYFDFSLSYADYTDLLDSILKELVRRDKGLDVNTSGYRAVMGRTLGSPIPGYDIIKRYVEFGGKILVLGSDAHKCSSIAHGFKATRDMLYQMGVRYMAFYDNRNPIFYKID